MQYQRVSQDLDIPANVSVIITLVAPSLPDQLEKVIDALSGEIRA